MTKFSIFLIVENTSVICIQIRGSFWDNDWRRSFTTQREECQIRSFFWTVFDCIRTRKNAVFRYFSLSANNRKRSSPSIEPWGIVHFNVPASQKALSIQMKNLLLERFGSNRLIIHVRKAKYFIFSRKIRGLKYQMLSKDWTVNSVLGKIKLCKPFNLFFK